MERTSVTPKSKVLSRAINCSAGISVGNESGPSKSCASSATPVREAKMFTDFDTDDSPLHIACTQEGSNNIDVVWDWNSPKAQQRPKQIQKRVIPSRSPKIPLKRHPSNTHIQNFEKLREELQNLRKEISVPDSEESLVLSPLEETKYKDVNNFHNSNSIPLPSQEDDDLFNDSVDEQLVLFSQRIETDLCNAGPSKIPLLCDNVTNTTTTVQPPLIKEVSDFNSVKGSIQGNTKNVTNNMCKIDNDSLSILEEFQIDSHKEFTKLVNMRDIKYDNKSNNHNLPRTKSENQNCKQTATGKVEFHRTQSFESTIEHPKEVIPQSKLDDIERKRKEALARLELKRKLDFTDSPVKCTAEEIEQKRLQALAKREAKRQQEIIERKRQEALKRLELNRKKNATMVKSSLTKRL